MTIERRCVALALGTLLTVTLQVSHVRGEEPVQPSWSPAATAKYLDGRAQWWLDWPSAARGQRTACISCHTALHFALARPALGIQLGESEAGAIEQRMLDNVKKRVANWGKIVGDDKGDKDPFRSFYGGQRKPSALGTESVVNALILVNHDVRRAKGILSTSARDALDQLWQQQQPNGAWLWLDFGLSPWEGDSSYYGASLAALAVGMAGKTYYDQAAIEPKVASLKAYLTTQYPKQRLHHRMTALWASAKLPGALSEQDRTKLVEEILTAQQTDGGWSSAKLGKTVAGKDGWTAHGVSQVGVTGDGYATGLAVLSLKSAGLRADHPALKHGIAWLVAAQKEGNWPATYLNRPRDPDTDVGKFMRDAATAFAALALLDSN